MFGAGEKSNAHAFSKTEAQLGTKQAVLNAKPVVDLLQFGRDDQLTIEEMKNAEK